MNPDDRRSAETSAQPEFAAALKLFMAGAVEDGIAVYRNALKAAADTLPVGLDLKFLQSARLHDVVDIVRKEALAAGADLCVNEAMD
jgi:hypothetical protein